MQPAGIVVVLFVCLFVTHESILTWIPYSAAFTAWIAFTQQVIVADFDVKSFVVE